MYQAPKSNTQGEDIVQTQTTKCRLMKISWVSKIPWPLGCVSSSLTSGTF